MINVVAFVSNPVLKQNEEVSVSTGEPHWPADVPWVQSVDPHEMLDVCNICELDPFTFVPGLCWVREPGPRSAQSWCLYFTSGHVKLMIQFVSTSNLHPVGRSMN